uniref:Uncharacterized protein n=1 Tax=Romanomermis culicivorax TaxID=13658 RepID=A0A915IUY6_ROMCU
MSSNDAFELLFSSLIIDSDGVSGRSPRGVNADVEFTECVSSSISLFGLLKFALSCRILTIGANGPVEKN